MCRQFVGDVADLDRYAPWLRDVRARSLGTLDGAEPTTTRWLAPTFAQRYPRVKLRSDRMGVSSGRLLTAGSVLAHTDLMLAIVARTHSSSLAHMVARYSALGRTRPASELHRALWRIVQGPAK